MGRLFAVLPLAFAALAVAGISPATAQVAGTYTGSTLDGNYVSFTVGTDTNTGNLAILGQSFSFSALCGDGSTFNTGWGLSYTADISGGKVSNVFPYPYLTNSFNLTFSRDGQSAKGKMETISPTLTPIGPKPKKALFCTSAYQPLSVALQPAGAPPSQPAPRAVWLGTPSSGPK